MGDDKKKAKSRNGNNLFISLFHKKKKKKIEIVYQNAKNRVSLREMQFLESFFLATKKWRFSVRMLKIV